MIVAKRFFALGPIFAILLGACAPVNPPFGQFIDDQLLKARGANGISVSVSEGYNITFSDPPGMIRKGETITVEVNSSKELGGVGYTICLDEDVISKFTGRLPQIVPCYIPDGIQTGRWTFTIEVIIDGSYYTGSFPVTITD
ncbi:hypothetical protein FACS1894190_05870 [Spirochaetia bacterium]|nr:hypothetical protein FACS1894190_05870 [Spirochaetia bacterium]